MSIQLSRRGISAKRTISGGGGTVTPTYVETASWTTGASGSANAVYKDLAISGCAVGDLLIVIGIGENNNTNGTRTVATAPGSAATTGTWTVQTPTYTTTNSDVEVVGGYAVVATAGTVTVRATVRMNSTSNHMGVAAFRIPAAQVGATYGWGTSFLADTDGQISYNPPSNSFIVYAAGDWTATTLTTSMVPSGGTVRRSSSGSANYGVWIANWVNQATGARNYGPSGLSSKDFSGLIFRMAM